MTGIHPLSIALLPTLLLAANSALAFQPAINLATSSSTLIYSTATGDVSEATVDDSSADGGSLIDFPPPLTGLQRTKRAIEFYKRALPVLAAYKAKEIELKLRPAASEEEEQQIWADLDEWGSTTIAETIKDMKGFYVKSGQGECFPVILGWEKIFFSLSNNCCVSGCFGPGKDILLQQLSHM